MGGTQGQESLPDLPGASGSQDGPQWLCFRQQSCEAEGRAPGAPHRDGDEAWNSSTCPPQGFCFCTTFTVAPASGFALLLAPEPSNLAGKDKHKPCVPTPMDLITRQRFLGQRLGFRIWEEERGMVCLPGGSSVGVDFSVGSLLACSLCVPDREKRRMAVFMHLPSYEA